MNPTVEETAAPSSRATERPSSPEEVHAPRSGRVLCAAVAVIVVTAIIALGTVTEIYLRATKHFFYNGDYEYDPDLGWRFLPGARFVYRAWEIATPVAIDDSGFRALPSGATDAPFRVAILGDSFTSNLAVRDEEVFTARMAELLRPGHAVHGLRTQGWQVSNLGVNGYGTVQEFLLYERLARSGSHFDLVIVNLYGLNDFDDNVLAQLWVWGRRRPRLVARGDGEVSFTDLPVPYAPLTEFWGFLQDHSAVVRQLLTLAQARRAVEVPAGWPYPPSLVGTPAVLRYGVSDPPPPALAAERATVRLLGRLRDATADRRTPLLVALAPSLFDLDPEYRHAAGEWLTRELGWRLDDSEPWGRVQSQLQAEGIAVCNLVPALEDRTPAALYHPRELHWTPEANAIVADLLAAAVVAVERGEPPPDHTVQGRTCLGLTSLFHSRQMERY